MGKMVDLVIDLVVGLVVGSIVGSIIDSIVVGDFGWELWRYVILILDSMLVALIELPISSIFFLLFFTTRESSKVC